MPYLDVFASTFRSTGGAPDTSNLFVNGTSNLFGTLNVSSRASFLAVTNTSADVNIAANLLVTANITGMSRMNIFGTSNLLGAVYMSSNLINTYGNVAITGNLVTSQDIMTNQLFIQSNLINTYGNVAITGNLVTSQNIYTNNIFMQSNLINTYGNVAITGNLVTSQNIYTNRIFMQSNLINTYGNVAITGNLVTSQNIYTNNIFMQSNLINTYGNVAITGNLVTTNVLCTNVIMRANLSSVTGIVPISGSVVVASNITCSNLSVTGLFDKVFEITASTYYYRVGDYTLPPPMTNTNGMKFFGINFNQLVTYGALPASRYITVTTNGNITFSVPGVFKLTGVLATDAAIGRIAYGKGLTDYTESSRATNSPYQYVYQFDVTQVPTITFTIPIVVTSTSEIFYFDMIAYRTVPTVLYATNATMPDYGLPIGGTYLAIGPM